ncbi:MAG: Glu-tRNA(Gln) amidotransferase subunit GatD [Thermoplasmata archaeon]
MSDDPWEELRHLPPGTRIELRDAQGTTWAGIALPRHDFSGERILPLKLASGYNVGVRIEPGARVLRREPGLPFAPERGEPTGSQGLSPPPAGGSPIALLTTGGTIASRIDYRTGGVRPVQTEEELRQLHPELAESGPVRIVPVMDRLSENIRPEDWTAIAGAVREAFAAGARGVVVSHGTDTLAYTAAALGFLLPRLPGPVVLVGAQRSPDRPSSDGRSNLQAAFRIARSEPLGEVVVVMHAGPGDDRFAVHRGTRVRKMHTTRRDAFHTVEGGPLGILEGGTVRWSESPRPPVDGTPPVVGGIDPRGRLLWIVPGLSSDLARRIAEGARGIVLAGTGLGHVPEDHLDWIADAIGAGVVVAMTSQCLGGAVDPYVYATGRALVRRGVAYLGDMLPETAYVKLLWALSMETTAEGVRRRLAEPVAGEMRDRRSLEGSP